MKPTSACADAASDGVDAQKGLGNAGRSASRSFCEAFNRRSDLVLHRILPYFKLGLWSTRTKARTSRRRFLTRADAKTIANSRVLEPLRFLSLM